MESPPLDGDWTSKTLIAIYGTMAHRLYVTVIHLFLQSYGQYGLVY
jgi:hypothetical protein